MAKTIGSFDLASLKVLRDDVTQYFWFEPDSSSAWGSGAHVTLYPESQFTDSTSPNYMKGQNIIMNTDGFSIRNGALPMMVLDNDSLDFNAIDTTLGTYTTMATFGLTGATIGQVSGAHIQISGSGLDVNTNSSTNIANFGINGARIGKSNGAHSIIDADGQRFYASNGTTQLANIGYASGVSESGYSATAPYYTFGTRASDTASTRGNYSVAEGYNTTASSWGSHAEGYNTVAGAVTLPSGLKGRANHAEGYDSEAKGYASHAEGYGTTANAYSSHAQNKGTIANGTSQTALGEYNIEDSTVVDQSTGRSNYAIILGNGTSSSRSNALAVDWYGKLFTNQIQAGTISGASISSQSVRTVNVTFDKTMSGTPIVVATLNTASGDYLMGRVSVAVSSISTTGFTCTIYNSDTSSKNPAVKWIAMNVGTP